VDARAREALRAAHRYAIIALLVLALVPLGAAAWLALDYARTQRDWLPGRGLATARLVLPAGAAADAGRAVLRDEFVYEREGRNQLCHWDDTLASYLPWLARTRAAARDRRWHVGMRPRLRIDPADPARCRPAYGWPEAVRLDLIAGILLGLLLAGGAVFLALTPRAPARP
jgi:hypothetical protein